VSVVFIACSCRKVHYRDPGATTPLPAGTRSTTWGNC